eukprot:139126-Alexandrium_andersonii.AAC.1
MKPNDARNSTDRPAATSLKNAGAKKGANERVETCESRTGEPRRKAGAPDGQSLSSPPPPSKTTLVLLGVLALR